MAYSVPRKSRLGLRLSAVITLTLLGGRLDEIDVQVSPKSFVT